MVWVVAAEVSDPRVYRTKEPLMRRNAEDEAAAGPTRWRHRLSAARSSSMCSRTSKAHDIESAGHVTVGGLVDPAAQV